MVIWRSIFVNIKGLDDNFGIFCSPILKCGSTIASVTLQNTLHCYTENIGYSLLNVDCTVFEK